MSWKSVFITLIVCVLFLPAVGFSQEIQRVDSLFFQGVEDFNKGHFNNVLQMMQLLDKLYPNHPRTTASLLMQAKAEYEMGNYQKSLNLFDRLTDRYSQSEYEDDALYGMGRSYYQLEMYDEAVSSLLDAVELNQDKQLMKKAAKLASDIMDYRMSLRDLKELQKRVRGEKAQAVATIRLAQRYMDEQQYQTSRQLLNQYLKQNPDSPYVFQIEQLLSQANRVGRDMVKIGIILPLSGVLQEQGKAILDGIQYAIQKHNDSNTEPAIEPIVRDSQGRTVPAVLAARELCETENVQFIIGELSSDVTAAIAGVAGSHNVLLLSPTATDEGISSIGNTVFQLNSDLSVRAEQLAEYAVEGLGIQRFAVLAPVDDYGRAMHLAFTEKVKELGAELVSETWYYEDTQDFKNQFQTIREKGLQLMLSDSVLIMVPKDKAEELIPEESPGPVEYVVQTFSELLDSTELAVTSIEGLFIPAYTEDLQYILPQVAFYNIQTQLFGGTLWHNTELLEKNQRYAENAVILSDFYIDPSDNSFYQFRDMFRKQTRTNPEKMEIYGYDAATLFLNILSQGSVATPAVLERLEKMAPFEGIKGVIKLDENRINNSVTMLQYRNGRFIRIR